MDLSWQQIKPILHRNGWRPLRQEGSHTIWAKGERRERIAVGKGHSMGGGGLKEVFKRFGIDMNEVTESPKVSHSRRGGNKTAEVPPEGTFGRRIYDGRTKLGLSQAGLAKVVNVQQAQISGWERNDTNPFHRKMHPNTKRVLLELGAQFGWDDDLLVTIKSAQEQVVSIAKGDIPTGIKVEGKHEVKPEFETKAKIRLPDGIPHKPKLEGPKVEAEPLVEPKNVKEKKSLAHILDADTIWIYVKECENEIEKLKLELSKAYREDMVEMKRKAKLYDEIRAKFEI